MDSKKCVWFVCVCVVLGGTSAFGQAVAHWDNGGEGPFWDVAENWDVDTIPWMQTTVYIDLPDANCLIDEMVGAGAFDVFLGYEPNMGGILDMTGGSLTLDGTLYIGEPEGSSGVLNINGGEVNAAGSLKSSYGKSTINISGGHILGPSMFLGDQEGAETYINISGGVIDCNVGDSDDLLVGRWGYGEIVMTGGLIVTKDKLTLGQKGGTGKVFLYGGTLQLGNQNLRIPNEISDTSHIEITGGTLLQTAAWSTPSNHRGDATARIGALVESGHLTAYGGYGEIISIYDYDTDFTTTTATPRLKAWDESPAHGETLEWNPDGAILSFQRSYFATGHEIYFGTDADAVAQADRNSPEFLDQQDKEPIPIETGPLSKCQTYYWRVDEISDDPNHAYYKGDVWTFMMGNYLVVEDFENYDNNHDAGTAVYQTWIDGYDDPSVNGCFVGDANGLIETEIVCGDGGQSMPFNYDFSQGAQVGEAVRTFDPARDWTREGMTAVSFWIYSDEYNKPNMPSMYVKINDVTILYSDSNLDNQTGEWLEWAVDLTTLATDVSQVTSMTIGIAGPTPQGVSGTFYIDDIRLYGPGEMCILELEDEG